MFLRMPWAADRVTCHCRGLCDGHENAVAAQSRSDEVISRLSRRQLLRTTLVGAAAGVLTSTGIELAAPRPALAQSTLNPEAALQALMDGNKRFVERRLTFYEEDLTILKQNTAEKQEPFASVLSCADSRVPSRSCSTRASGMCSSIALPATSRLRRLSPASNMASRCWARGS